MIEILIKISFSNIWFDFMQIFVEEKPIYGMTHWKLNSVFSFQRISYHFSANIAHDHTCVGEARAVIVRVPDIMVCYDLEAIFWREGKNISSSCVQWYVQLYSALYGQCTAWVESECQSVVAWTSDRDHGEWEQRADTVRRTQWQCSDNCDPDKLERRWIS